MPKTENDHAENKPGTLYLCATPIGNLEDITLRVLRILKEADLIAAEDTRNTIKLLNHFEIKTPLTSYHEFNKVEKGPVLVDQLLEGKNIALVTDAGTPAVSDPGELLVQMAVEAGIPVTSLPGACACVTALTISGLSTRRFCFEAFLPQEKKERRRILESLKDETRTIIIYEAPHRLLSTLVELSDILGNRRISLCRELTKKYETAFRTDLENSIAYYRDNEPKGEFVLVIEGRSIDEIVRQEADDWQKLTVEEHMKHYLEQGMDKKDAMKAAAKDRGVSKQEIYKELLNS